MGFYLCAIKSNKDYIWVNYFTWVYLWENIVNNCGDIFTEKQIDYGYHNECIKIEEKQAKVIADFLKKFDIRFIKIANFINESGGFYID